MPQVKQSFHYGRWTAALFIVFMLLGSAWGTWLTRFPTIRDTLGLRLDEMSILVLMPSLGAMVGLIFAGRIVMSVGERTVIVVGIVLMGVCLPSGTWFLLEHHTLVSYVFLMLFGAGFGVADVASNVSGSAMERSLERPRLVLLHAGFSVGGIGSVVMGAIAERIQLGLLSHQLWAFGVTVALTLVLGPWVPSRTPSTAPAIEPPTGATFEITATGPIPLGGPTPELASTEVPYQPVRVWRDPRVLLLGFIALAGSLADGVATDWMPLAFIDEYGLYSDAAVLVLSLMFVSELIVRLMGDRLLIRFGRVRVLKVTLTCSFVGIMLVALSPWWWLAVPGAFFWGVGSALAFPIGISAAADNPATAARAVSAVSTIAYTAYAMGPVAFGFMGEHFGLRVAFVVLACIIALGWVASSQAGERGRHG